MPHRCTKCGKVYPDGDKRILKGCECGNNKFIYIPKSKLDRDKAEKPEKEKVEIESVESVKIISPGMYEINLEKVFSREEIVIALQDGKYAIHLPSLVGRLEKKRKKEGKTKKS